MPYYRSVAQAAAATPDRIGVLLVNLGTPDSPTYGAVRRYLREFLGDHRVVGTPRWIWLPLLYGLVLPLRPFKSARNYRRIWTPEGSPLAVYSTRLADKIEQRLRRTAGDRVRVALGMTYGNPRIDGAIQALAQQNVRRLLVLPLYPQYCSSTTGSAFERAVRALRRWRWLPETRFVNGYSAEPDYLDALTASIEEHWERIGERSHLVFSYHGIPVRYVDRGDPYRTQAEATTRMVASRLRLQEGGWSHCYQSRFGPAAWLRPYTEDALRELVARGIRRVTVVSPSFSVDCLETLQEVAIEYAGKFLEFGAEHLSLVPALNDDDRHADALAAVIRKHLRGWPA